MLKKKKTGGVVGLKSNQAYKDSTVVFPAGRQVGKKKNPQNPRHSKEARTLSWTPGDWTGVFTG